MVLTDLHATRTGNTFTTELIADAVYCKHNFIRIFGLNTPQLAVERKF